MGEAKIYRDMPPAMPMTIDDAGDALDAKRVTHKHGQTDAPATC